MKRQEFYYRKSRWVLILLSMMLSLSSAAIVFQQPTNFGTMQVQLTSVAGYIAVGTPNIFTIANPGYQNISSLGLAMCGFDIPNPTNLQYRAEISYDSSANSIVVLLLPFNTTKVAFLNYFVIVSTQQVESFLYVQNACLQPPSNYDSSYFGNQTSFTFPSPFVSNSTSTVTGVPYIRSVNSFGANKYNYVQINSIISIPSTNQFTVTLIYDFNYQSEVCLSVVCYWNSIGLRYNLLNISYSNNFLIIDSSSSTQNLITVSQQNFTLSNIFGPIFNRKCLVGFQSWKISSLQRQTFSFNLTGNGIYGITTSTNSYVQYSWFCMAEVTCKGTLAQYYPLINDCQEICAINNCSVCGTSTSCLTCSEGFYVNTLYRCNSCIANCNNCTSSTSCTVCATGYYFNQTACVSCAQFCNSCTAGGCSVCQTGYYQNSGQCIQCAKVLPNCLTCNSGTVCSVCLSGFYPAGGCSACNQSMLGCSTCESASYCYQCVSTYYLVGSTCKTCIYSVPSCCPTFVSNCSVCSSTTACSTCQVGYYRTNSNKSCTQCTTTLPNCISCSNSAACTICNTSYFLNAQNQCTSCLSSIAQCTLCTNATYCTYCQLPFIMANGTCLNCPIWPTNSLYYLDANNVCQLCLTVTPSCILCASQQVCSQCSDLYYLSNNICELCSNYMANCLSCLSNATCTICGVGYFPDLANSTICVLCNSKISHCTACSQSLVVTTNNYSVVCISCQNQYFLNSTQCTLCSLSIQFCIKCSNNYQCHECEVGYYLGSSQTCITCTQLIPGCSSCQSSSICVACIAGYYLINNYCTQCKMAINNCFVCGSLNNTLTCSSCLPGYYISLNFVCNSCNSLQFCSTCSSSSACSSCIPGYVVNYNNTCSLCTYLITNCQYCTQTICIKCLANYTLNKYGDCQGCIQYISGCSVCENIINNITLQNQLSCSTCSDGYLQYLSGSIAMCVACNVSISNCISCASLTQCNTCNSLSFINSQYTCSLCSLYLPNCLYCNVSSTCITCAGSYYLNSNQACEYCDSSQFGTDSSALKQNVCLSCKYLSGVPTCLNCISGYFVFNNACASCANTIPNCLSCATSTICIQCSSGYSLSANNTLCINCPLALPYCSLCDLNGLCLKCQGDCYLNATLNSCIKCYKATPGCYSCNSNGTCEGCLDGYYMSGLACLSCSAAMKDCLICNNSTICLLYQSSSSVSTSNSFLTSINSKVWMYIALGCFTLFILLAVLYIIWRKCKQQKEQQLSKQNKSAVIKSHTDRELNVSSALDNNDVKINHEQLCQHCKNHNFQVMNIELLCAKCEAKQRNNKDHIIRKQILKKGEKRDNESSSLKSKGRSQKTIKREKQDQKQSKKWSEEQLEKANSKKMDKIDSIKENPKLKYTQSEYIDKVQNKKQQFIKNQQKNKYKGSKQFI